jgi:peptidoglycan hydrolase-like protein with peptidoglycan-binding domain
MARAYHAANASWWVWQGLPRSNWVALSQRISSLSGYRPDTSYARLMPGAQGDLVVWAQEHLASAGQSVTIDGSFGAQTEAAVRRFQRAHRISAVGSIGPITWAALLRYRPVRVTWRTRGGRPMAGAAGAQMIQVPLSARLPAKRYEIPPRLGAGRPPG